MTDAAGEDCQAPHPQVVNLLFLAKDFNSISLWKWEVCSAYAHPRAFFQEQYQSGEGQRQGLKHGGGGPAWALPLCQGTAG